MRIIEISALDNGAHRNQTGTFTSIPDGWAVIPNNIAIPDTFPFVNIEVDEQTVTAMTAGIIPEPEPSPDLTPSELRENAYNTERVIEWDGDMLTVTEASQKWQYYASEGSDKANQLQQLIVEAKEQIRNKYPDKEV